MELNLLTAALVGLGLILGYVIAHFRGQSALSREQERVQNLTNRLDRSDDELEASRHEKSDLEKQLATARADHRNLLRRLEEKEQEMEKFQKRFKEQFENLANKILEEKSKKFTEQNKEKLDQLLKPLGTKIEEFQKRVEEAHKEDLKGRGALMQHLKHLQEHNLQISQDAKNLTKALKGESKTQGSWGEVFLQRVLEMSGLQEGREYETQQSITINTEGGRRRLQPDVVVYLPEDKRVIIDSKVSLTAYEQFVSAEEEAERKQAAGNHVISIRKHVKELGEKNYEQLYEGASPDFVLLFVPIESAFGLAARHDPDLFSDAFAQGIVIVSPSTLLATLKTIDSMWRREDQNRNAIEIAKRGGALYDKFVLFAESMEDVGNRIRQTQDSFEQAMGRLKTGRGSLTSQVQMLRKLGARASKQLPESFEDRSQLEEGAMEEELEE